MGILVKRCARVRKHGFYGWKEVKDEDELVCCMDDFALPIRN